MEFPFELNPILGVFSCILYVRGLCQVQYLDVSKIMMIFQYIGPAITKTNKAKKTPKSANLAYGFNKQN